MFGGLTVDENLRVAAWQIRHDHDRVAARIAEAHRRFPVLAQRSADQAGDLSGGQQQQLALAMALLTEPEVLLIDELSLGLAPLVVEQLLDELRVLREGGTTIVIVVAMVIWLGISGLIEGFETGSTINAWLKIALGVVACAAFWLTTFVAGRRAVEAGTDPGLSDEEARNQVAIAG